MGNVYKAISFNKKAEEYYLKSKNIKKESELKNSNIDKCIICYTLLKKLYSVSETSCGH